MTDSSRSRLSALQTELLGAFFEHTERFFLTGGGALAAFYLRHRETKDLDLFATAEVDIRDGVSALYAAASDLGATVESMRESGDFRRYAVQRGEELTVVDLVIDRTPQVTTEKTRFGRIRVDALHEIAANKLCAVLDRTEARDLMDLKLLLDTGLRLEDVLSDAQRKHASIDAATLAWCLSQIQIEDGMAMPEGTKAADLEAFREALIRHLTGMALPKE